MNKKNKVEYLKLKNTFQKYKLTEKDMKFIWQLIKPIFLHEEFQKRLKDPYFHHQNTTIGEHIIADTVISYKICKNHKLSIDVIKRTLLIAMFHDLYVYPWMNHYKKEKKVNCHAFVHPIEAIINAITWYPEYFKNPTDAKIIIDGVLHHMYPLPVRSASLLDWEIFNQKEFNKLDSKYKNIIIKSLKPYLSKNLSLRKSIYLEGRIVSRADKIVALLKDIHGKEYFYAAKRVAGLCIPTLWKTNFKNN